MKVLTNTLVNIMSISTLIQYQKQLIPHVSQLQVQPNCLLLENSKISRCTFLLTYLVYWLPSGMFVYEQKELAPMISKRRNFKNKHCNIFSSLDCFLFLPTKPKLIQQGANVTLSFCVIKLYYSRNNHVIAVNYHSICVTNVIKHNLT